MGHAGLERALAGELQLELPVGAVVQGRADPGRRRNARRASSQDADDAYQAKVELVGAESFHQFERNVMLQSLDTHWREHLAALDHLRQGIHLRGYAQKNPKQEYKREAFELFEGLLDRVREEVTRVVLTVQIRSAEDVEETAPHAEVQNVQYQHADYDEALGDDAGAHAAAAAATGARRPQGRPQRSLPVRLGQEIQALPRQT